MSTEAENDVSGYASEKYLDWLLCQLKWDHVTLISRELVRSTPSAFAFIAQAEAEVHYILARCRDRDELKMFAGLAFSARSELEDILKRLRSNVQKIDVSNECSHLITSLISYVKLLEGDYPSAISLTKEPSFKNADLGIYKYSQAVRIRTLTIQGMAYETTKDTQNALKIYTNINFYVQKSWAAMLFWIDILFAHIAYLSAEKIIHDKSLFGFLTKFHPIDQNLPSSASVEARINLMYMYFVHLTGNIAQRPKSTELHNDCHAVFNELRGLLFNHTFFPRAEDTNEIMEGFIDCAVHTWRIFLPIRIEEMKRILIAASSKTFHSLSVLRGLLFLDILANSFSDAKKVLLTYLSLMEKAKVRAAKGADNIILDDYDTYFDTISIGIRLSVQSLDQPLLAYELSRKLKDDISSCKEAQLCCDQKKLSTAWSAVADGFSFYSDSMSDYDRRAEMHMNAEESYLLSIKYNTNSVGARYHFARFLSRTGKTSQAIEQVKVGLELDDSHIGLWHLFVLLLSALQEYEKAIAACQSALDIYQPVIQELSLNNMRKSDISHAPAHKQSKKFDTGLAISRVKSASHKRSLSSSDNEKNFLNRVRSATFRSSRKSSEKTDNPINALKSRNDQPADRSISAENMLVESIISLKLTEIALVESMLGPESALEILADLFSLEAKIKSERTRRSGSPERSCWLAAAGIYRRAGRLEDALKCVKEAANIAVDGEISQRLRKCIDTCVAVEYGLINKCLVGSKSSLGDLEEAFAKDPESPLTVTALAHLLIEEDGYFLPSLRERGSQSLVPSQGLVDSAAEDANDTDATDAANRLFTSNMTSSNSTHHSLVQELDDSCSFTTSERNFPTSIPLLQARHSKAAYSHHRARYERASQLLTACCLHRGWNVPEVWWLASRLWEKFGRYDLAKDGYMKCAFWSSATGVRDWNAVLPYHQSEVQDIESISGLID